jgi:hypothetical protein
MAYGAFGCVNEMRSSSIGPCEARDDSLARFFRGEGSPARFRFSRSTGSCAATGAQCTTVMAVPIASASRSADEHEITGIAATCVATPAGLPAGCRAVRSLDPNEVQSVALPKLAEW